MIDRAKLSEALIHPAQRETMRQAAWDMYVAAILGMAYHPGTTRDAAVRRPPQEIANLADEMMEQRDQRFGRVE